MKTTLAAFTLAALLAAACWFVPGERQPRYERCPHFGTKCQVTYVHCFPGIEFHEEAWSKVSWTTYRNAFQLTGFYNRVTIIKPVTYHTR